MDALRYYRIAECDERGYPLDWEKCRSCKCTGKTWPVTLAATQGKCGTCDGHGSLKAAALAGVALRAAERARTDRSDVRLETPPLPIRCEDCGHPMSEGTWEGDPPEWLKPLDLETMSKVWLEQGDRGLDVTAVHYSPCDEGCRHGGPGREVTQAHVKNLLTLSPDPWEPGGVGYLTSAAVKIEASWRQVDVRTLDRPCMLEPEFLAVLCLRCWAERSKS